MFIPNTGLSCPGHLPACWCNAQGSKSSAILLVPPSCLAPGDPWSLQGARGHPGSSQGTPGHPWSPPGGPGHPRSLPGPPGHPWSPLGAPGHPWSQPGGPGHPWSPPGPLGIPRLRRGALSILSLCRGPWAFLVSAGGPWASLASSLWPWSREKAGPYTSQQLSCLSSPRPLEPPAPLAPRGSAAQTLVSHHRPPLSRRGQGLQLSQGPSRDTGHPSAASALLALQTPVSAGRSPGWPQPSPTVPAKLGFPDPLPPQASHPCPSEKGRCLQGQAGVRRGLPGSGKEAEVGGGSWVPCGSAGPAEWGVVRGRGSSGDPFTPHTISQKKSRSPQERLWRPAPGPRAPTLWAGCLLNPSHAGQGWGPLTTGAGRPLALTRGRCLPRVSLASPTPPPLGG